MENSGPRETFIKRESIWTSIGKTLEIVSRNESEGRLSVASAKSDALSVIM